MSSLKIDNARLQWQQDGRPFASDYRDVYFSRGDEVAESLHVFLTANSLESRWEKRRERNQSFVIGELGLGCTLNFLNTWQLWQQFKARHPESPLRLHYMAMEKHPLTLADLQRVHLLWPQFAELSSRLLASYPDHSTGCHRLVLQDDVILDLHYGDARESLRQIVDSESCSIDCWFADGFNPKSNPALWQSELFGLIARCSGPGTTLTSYSVAGTVRRALQEHGFSVDKAPGFGSKRHMLSARFEAASRSDAATNTQSGIGDQKQITIIGAGLAGSALAHGLARRNWQVTVLEAETKLLTGASGSGQLNLRCHLAAKDLPLTRFYLHAFLFARRQFALLPKHEKFWHPCGLAQLDSSLKPSKRGELAAYKEKLPGLYDKALLELASAEQLSSITGVTLKSDGLYLPLGGWIDPAGLLAAYLDHPNIELNSGARVERLARKDNHWQCLSDDDRVLSQSPLLALCTGAGIQRWSQTSALPLQPVRGQNTFIQHGQLRQQLRAVVCGKRTLFPGNAGKQTVSASYQREVQSLSVREKDDEENLRLLGEELPTAKIDSAVHAGSKVAIRYNSIDHAPVIGAMPDWRLDQEAGELSYVPGLYVNTAHASSGLATCALAGEHLASVINEEPLPLGMDIVRQLVPERFLLRERKKRGI